jgi:hypothetical protein
MIGFAVVSIICYFVLLAIASKDDKNIPRKWKR